MQDPGSDNPELTDYNKSELERIQRGAENRKLWRAQMAENEAIKTYLDSIHPIVREPFINFYLAQKNLWVENNGYYQKQMTNEGIEWIDPATDHLKLIQQKKLFDKQCLWRAEKIKIEEVSLCVEFEQWEHSVFNCPFIEPVTGEEMEEYAVFLQQSEQDTELQLYHQWQNYEKIKLAYEAGNNDLPGTGFPAWYQYQNTISDGDLLMQLPDIRGEKEKFYTGICHTAMKAEGRDPMQAGSGDPDHVSKIFDKGHVEWFVDKFETKEVKRCYKTYSWWSGKTEMENLMFDDLRTLFNAGEIIPIEASHYWVLAVQQAAAKYRRKKIAEALPDAWEQYMLNIQTGISFDSNTIQFDKYEKVKKLQERTIIAGRLLQNEPPDLNF